MADDSALYVFSGHHELRRRVQRESCVGIQIHDIVEGHAIREFMGVMPASRPIRVTLPKTSPSTNKA